MTADCEKINRFSDQPTSEKFRILLSFIDEYIGDESSYAGSRTRNHVKPLTDFIYDWINDNNIVITAKLFRWNMPARVLNRTCPRLGVDLANFIDSTWSWYLYSERVNLANIHGDIIMFFEKLRYSGPNRFRQLLTSKGFRLLGAGAYSEVWGKSDSKWVYKLNKGCDDGWCEYVTWATMKGYTSSYAPRVESLKKFAGFYVAKMEKLNKTLSELTDDMEFFSRPSNQRAYNSFEMLRRYVRERELATINPSDREEIDRAFPGMIEFFNDLIKEFPRYAIDIHHGNFMVDENNFIVVTDPIVGAPQTESSPRIKHGTVV